MSELYPEDILSRRLSLQTLAKDALKQFDEDRRAADALAVADEAEDLIADVWDFVTDTLKLPDHILEDVSFEVESHNPGKARVTWTIDGIHMRVYYTYSSDGRRPIFEARSGVAQFGQAWKTFSDLVSLGRLI